MDLVITTDPTLDSNNCYYLTTVALGKWQKQNKTTKRCLLFGMKTKEGNVEVKKNKKNCCWILCDCFGEILKKQPAEYCKSS